MDVSSERAQSAGLVLTDPTVTASDTRAWLRGKDIVAALAPEREAVLIQAARERGTEQH